MLKSVMPRQNILLFLFGFLGLSYEILASKVFFSFYTESSQSLSLVISLFLIGLALGSLMYSRYASTVSKPRLFVAAHVVMATYLCFALLGIDSIIVSVGNIIGSGEIINQIVVGVIILLPPAMLLGAVFPFLLSGVVGTTDNNSGVIGKSNAFDLTGSVVGGLAAGFIFIPELGISKSVLIIYSIHIVALVLFIGRWRLRYMLFAVFLMGFVFAAGSNYYNSPVIVNEQENITPVEANEILYNEESQFERVRVVEEKEENGNMLRRLILGNRQQCDTRSFDKHNVSEIHFVERALSQIEPEARTLNIGLGCGLTAGLLSSSDKVNSLDIVEINPKVPDAAKLFSEYNNNVLENPKTELTIKDGYEYLGDKPSKYDLIAMDVEAPTVLHSSRLYSVENFRQAATRLENKGIFAVWAFNNFDIEFTKIIHNSLLQAFEHVYIVQSGVYNDMYFLASQQPLNRTQLRQSEADKALEARVLANDSNEVQTLDHNALGRFWR